ncbi:MAG: hypothetical protein BRD29_01995 [Bacteroidetes bacterium QH_2_67_10]|nr:MAG: hypothetical protein BRD29_01995 [Bacteroidetes bacterium QH_2_67_10]
MGDERAVQQAILSLIRGGYVNSAHDVSDGGLAVALAESAIFAEDRLGAEVELFPEDDAHRLDALLFGEAQSRVLFTASRDEAEMVGDALVGRGVRAEAIGRVTDGGGVRLNVSGERVLDAERGALAAAHEEAIPALMGA